VIVLNFNGHRHLGPCFDSLLGLDYPRDRIVLHLVDNGSADGSVAFMARRFPDVKLTEHRVNVGFSVAINRAVEAAETPMVAFLNNDTRVDPAWLTELLAPLVDGTATAAGSRLIDWDGQQDLFQGAGCNFHGIGFQAGLHGMAQAEAEHGRPVDALFSCGAAMAIERDAFLDAGGFDEDFFAFYEDVDLGWRLWLFGQRVVLAPRSIVYHHHSATASQVPIHRLRVLHIRNPLLTILKNYESINLQRVLPAALMLTIQRTAFLANLDTHDFRIEAQGGAEPAKPQRRWRFLRNARETLTVPKLAFSDLVALDDVNRQFERVLEKRVAIQRRRRRPDREILPLFRNPFWPAEQAESYLRLQRCLVDFFGIDEVFGSDLPAPESG